MKHVTAVTTPTDHVTTDVVQAGQEALVKNVSKIYIDKLNDSTIQKTETYILVERITTFPNVCQRKNGEGGSNHCGKCLYQNNCFIYGKRVPV